MRSSPALSSRPATSPPPRAQTGPPRASTRRNGRTTVASSTAAPCRGGTCEVGAAEAGALARGCSPRSPWPAGNHDAFGVDSIASDHFLSHSASSSRGELHQRDRVAAFDVDRAGARVRVVLFDGTPRPGAHRPFNFFGTAPKEALDDLDAALAAPFPSHPAPAGAARIAPAPGASGRPDHTFFVSHYPAAVYNSGLSSAGRSLRQLLADRGATAILCGHLHTLFGAMTRMYARHGDQSEGLLELEVGDMKDSDRCRAGQPELRYAALTTPPPPWHTPQVSRGCGQRRHVCVCGRGAGRVAAAGTPCA